MIRPKASAGRRPTVEQRQRSEANERLAHRRASLRKFNRLPTERSADHLVMDPKDVPTQSKLDRALNFLDARCTDGRSRSQFVAALQAWIDNGGALPEGVQFVGGSLQVVGDVEVTAPAVPMHRVLKKSFVLKSQAFMLTYNSKAFTRDT